MEPYCLIKYPAEQLKVIYIVLTTYKLLQLFHPLLHRHNSAIIGFVCHLLAGEGQGNPQDFAGYSVELMTFVTGLAISIPGIVQTIYALLINFQT